jgi:hypothetical protein
MRLAQPRQSHLRRILVFDSHRNRVGLRVLNVDTDARLGAHRKSSTEFARDANAVWKLTTTGVDYRQGEQREVVSESNPAKPWSSPGKRKQDEARRNQDVEKFCENKPHSIRKLWSLNF